jgi:hypothetical protein
MPVSYLPCITPFLLIGIPLLLLFKSRRAAARAALITISLFSLVFLWIYIPGWCLYVKARSGNAAAQYSYAQWLENHSEQVGTVIIWPFEPDVLEGYSWLEKSANQNYPPAVWLLGARLKFGEFVREPPGWTGPGGNVFPQPIRGQALMDHAVKDLGYPAPGDPEKYYWQNYRRGESPYRPTTK